MPHAARHALAPLLLVAAVQLSGCGEDTSAERVNSEPAVVEKRGDVSRVRVAAQAAKRLDIKTTPVAEAPVGAGGAVRSVIPYGAVLYDPQGETWTYTSPEPLVFVRQHIVVDHIEGDTVVLSDGPAVGTAVVTVGAVELYGIEFGVGE